MQRLGIYLLALTVGSYAAGSGLAQPDPQSLPERAVIEQFGERQLLELRPNPDGSHREFTVYALSRPAGIDQIMRPRDGGGQIVNTASQEVRLPSGETRSVTQVYVNQPVAYLRLEATVSVRDGWLDVGGQRVWSKSSSGSFDLLWGTAWTLTFGLVSLFWLPNLTESTTYARTIPIPTTVATGAVTPYVGTPLLIEYGGGGNCFAFQDYDSSLSLDSGLLQPGRVYVLRTRVACGSPAAGIVGSAEVLTAPVRVEYERVGLPAQDARGIDPAPLQHGLPVGSGGEVRDYTPFPGWFPINPGQILPFSYSLGQVDRLWSTTWFDDPNTRSYFRFDQPYDGRPIPVCMAGHWDSTPEDRQVWVCDSRQNFRRTAADPAGPVTLPTPSMAQEATAVYFQQETGPTGEQVSRLVVDYRPPAPVVVSLRDVFEPY
jgi:hypothetical protein